MLEVTLTLVVGVSAIGASRAVLHRFGVFDVPNARSSHRVIVVRGGGIGIGLAICTGLVAASGLSELNGFTGFVVAFVGFGSIGLIEDLRPNTSVAVRFVGQLVVGGIAAIALLAGTGTPVAGSLALLVVTTGWLVAFTNVFNFMDGINGISGVEATLIAGTVSALALLKDDPAVATVAAVVAAAALSFLPYNLYRARLFMGDVGSYLLGAGLAALLVLGIRADISAAALIAPYLPYVADSSMTLVGRLIRRERWWEPHREHVYQRLVDAGWSHLRTTLWIGGITATCGVTAIVGQSVGGAAPALAMLVAIGATAAYLASPACMSQPASPPGS